MTGIQNAISGIPPKVLWGIIAIGSLIIILFVALLLRLELSPKPELPTPARELSISVIDGITVSTDLPAGLAESAVSFVKRTTDNSLHPKELMIRLYQQKNALRGDMYLGTWGKEDKNLSVLVGLTSDNAKIQYMRTWATQEASTSAIDPQNLLRTYYSPGFISEFSKWDCEATQSADIQKQLTCEDMVTLNNEDLMGYYVQYPFSPELLTGSDASSSNELILISACSVPSGSKATYTADRCL